MKIFLWGGKSNTRVLIRMIEELYGRDAAVKGVFDSTLQALPFASDVPLVNTKQGLNQLIGKCTHFVSCIGGEHGYARHGVSEKLKSRGLIPVSLVSRHSLLDDLDSVGEGLQMMPGAIVHKFSSVGNQCILNTNSTVDHECEIGNGVHVMGGAAIAGRVKIGDYSTIGTNATILPNIKIGRNVYIGAGAVVIDDIADGDVVAGVPAKILRKFEPKIDLSFFD